MAGPKIRRGKAGNGTKVIVLKRELRGVHGNTPGRVRHRGKVLLLRKAC